MSKTISLPARRYAKALFYESSGSQDLAQIVISDMEILKQAFAGKELVDYMTHLAVDSKSKKEKLLALLANLIGKETTKFIDFLAFKKRINLLPEITISFLDLVEEKNGLKRVFLEVASPLGGFVSEITQVLEKKLNKKIKLEVKENSKLLGGFRYEVDGWVYDCSVQGKIDSLKKVLV